MNRIYEYAPKRLSVQFFLLVKFQQRYKVSQARESGIVWCPLDAEPLDSLLNTPIRPRPVIEPVR
jgi:hypothetical protein